MSMKEDFHADAYQSESILNYSSERYVKGSDVEGEQELDDFPSISLSNEEKENQESEAEEEIQESVEEIDDRGTLFHRFPGQEDPPFAREITTPSKKLIDILENEDQFLPLSEKKDMTDMPSRKWRAKASTEQDIIKERLDACNRQLVSEQERRMSRKVNETGRRQSIISKMELITIQGLIQSILDKPEGQDHRTGKTSGTRTKQNDSLAAKPILRKRFLKLRTHKSIDHSKKKAPSLPVTPPKPNPFRKGLDQELDSSLEKLLIVKKEVRYDASKPKDLKEILYVTKAKPPPSRKGPFYEEPFKAGMTNARFQNLLKKIDSTVANLENGDAVHEENQIAEEYIHQEFKKLISSGGFYPSISYTPAATILFEKESIFLDNCSNSGIGNTWSRKIPSTAPARCTTNYNHFDPIPSSAEREFKANHISAKPLTSHQPKNIDRFNEKHTKPISPYIINHFKNRAASTDPKSDDKRNIVIIVGTEGTKQNDIATPLTLPSLHKSKTNNPLQSIITGMENHGILKKAKFRIAFHRNYKEEFHLQDFPLILKKKEKVNQTEYEN